MCTNKRCPYAIGPQPCPFEIGQHPVTLADARDQRIATEAIFMAGRIEPAEAERAYAAFKARIALTSSSRKA